MISKVIIGKSFSGCCKYVCQDSKRSEILMAEGVRTHDTRLMAKDFEAIRSLKPNKQNAVFHGIISFHPEERITPEMMKDIAKDYLQQMKLNNTQFVVAQHTDKSHQHMHIIANLVNYDGQVIKDSWIGAKGKTSAINLTAKYKLKEADKKNLKLIHKENLRTKDATKYKIYEAIQTSLPAVKSVDELKNSLQKQGIETILKLKSNSKEVQGVSFKANNITFKGSTIDRTFSFAKLSASITEHALSTSFNLVKKTIGREIDW